MSSRQLHLNVNLLHSGVYASAWRLPESDPRAGLNAVTTADAAASRNFGLPGVLEHKARYDRAKEFAEVVHALWDSWEDDAFVGDKASARFVDTSKEIGRAH